MAIFTTLITATKLLVKNMAKKKLKEKAKSFVTGDKDKKKKGKEVKREKVAKIMGDQGAKSYGADQVTPVETQTQTISPSKFMGASTGDAPKIEPKSSGRVDFNSLNKRLDNIVGMTDMIVVATKATAQQKKDELNILSENRKKQEAKARQAKLKAKKPGLIGKAVKGIKKKAQNPLDAMMKFLVNIAFGALAVFLINNAKKIKKIFEFLGKNLNFVSKVLRIAIFEFKTGFSATKQIFKFLKVDKILSPVGKALKGIGSTVFKVLKGLGGVLFKVFKNLPGIKQIGQLINLSKKIVGGGVNLLGKTKNFLTGGGKETTKKIGSNIMKKGLRKAPGRLFLKIFGKKGAKIFANAGKAFKNLSILGKSVKIPILGPIIVAVTSMLSGDPVQQTLFKSIGAGFGGLIGSMGGPLGMIVGEIVGEFLGNFLFELFNGDPSGAKGKELLKKRFDQIVSGVGKYGKMFLDFVMAQVGKIGNFFKEGMDRFIENFPVIDISEIFGLPSALGAVSGMFGIDDPKFKDGGKINRIPNMSLLTPFGMGKLLPHLKNSFFPSGEKEQAPESEETYTVGPEDFKKARERMENNEKRSQLRKDLADGKITQEEFDEKFKELGGGVNLVKQTDDNSDKIAKSNDVSGGGSTAELGDKDTSSVASTTSAVSTQASYEESSAGTVILGDPNRSNFPPGAGGDAQFQRAMMLVASQKDMLNSYYKTQVKASLYKV